MNFFDYLFGSLSEMGWWDIGKMLIMFAIGGVLIFLAIKKKMEPALLLPLGFGAILVNLPFSGAITQGNEDGPLNILYDVGIATDLLPLLLFIGIGAMIDFGPVLSNPKLLIFGAAAQLGIFITLILTATIGNFTGLFSLQDSASIAIIGAADGPSAIFVANYYGTKFIGPIMVAAYSYMALVPIIQPPVIKLFTTKKERLIRMPYNAKKISKPVKILFPIIVTIVAGLIVPKSVALVGFLMFGNLIRECTVLENLSETAQNALANLVTILLGITVAIQLQADKFLSPETLMIMGLGLFAFIFNTIGGVTLAKLVNLLPFVKNKINPMIGACGISAFPMSARVINKMGLKEDPQNHLLMHAVGVNVGGQIASVIAAGMVLALIL